MSRNGDGKEVRNMFNFIRKRRKKEREHTCAICLMSKTKVEIPKLLSCNHKACFECLREYFRTQINSSSVNITCPHPGCYSTYTPKHVKTILKNDYLNNKYEEFMVRKVLLNEPDCRWCPTPDCGYAVIATGCAACPLLKCEKCSTEFCYHCKGFWHPNQTCDDARKHVQPVFFNNSGNDEVVKKCPRCMAHVTKMDDGSCNHMTCAVCGVEFCWLCLREVTDIHYLSPTGCTFWGKRTWSRKKRVLWQMGTLIGAPFGICLLSAVALPAILIAVPAYVGRRLNCIWKKRKVSTAVRALITTCGVTIASLCSPVIAGISVSVGVPIMIAFVYTVVPFLICRGEGCFGGNPTDVQIPITDLNDHLQGLQNHLYQLELGMGLDTKTDMAAVTEGSLPDMSDEDKDGSSSDISGIYSSDDIRSASSRF